MIRTPYFIAAVILGSGFDQLTKFFAQLYLSFYTPLIIIAQTCSFQLVHNYGAAYGVFQHQRLLLLLVSTVVLIGITVYRKSLAKTIYSQMGLLFLYVGTFGNGIDRLFRGYVVDFIDIRIFPVFNIADMCINIGVALFIIEMIFHHDRITSAASE